MLTNLSLLQNEYIEYKEIQAAQGAKIAAKDLEKAIAGTFVLLKF
jgi:translation initiation factor IF-2